MGLIKFQVEDNACCMIPKPNSAGQTLQRADNSLGEVVNEPARPMS